MLGEVVVEAFDFVAEGLDGLEVDALAAEIGGGLQGEAAFGDGAAHGTVVHALGADAEGLGVRQAPDDVVAVRVGEVVEPVEGHGEEQAGAFEAASVLGGHARVDGLGAEVHAMGKTPQRRLGGVLTDDDLSIDLGDEGVVALGIVPERPVPLGEGPVDEVGIAHLEDGVEQPQDAVLVALAELTDGPAIVSRHGSLPIRS